MVSVGSRSVRRHKHSQQAKKHFDCSGRAGSQTHNLCPDPTDAIRCYLGPNIEELNCGAVILNESVLSKLAAASLKFEKRHGRHP